MSASILRGLSTALLSMSLVSCIPSGSGGDGNDDDDDDRGGQMANGGMAGTGGGLSPGAGGGMDPGAGGGMDPGAGGMMMSGGGDMPPMGGMSPPTPMSYCDRMCATLRVCLADIDLDDCIAECRETVERDPERARMSDACAEMHLADGRCDEDAFVQCMNPDRPTSGCENVCQIFLVCDPNVDVGGCVAECRFLEENDPERMMHTVDCALTHLADGECDNESYEQCEDRDGMGGGDPPRGCDYICNELRLCTDEFDLQRCLEGCRIAIADDAAELARIVDCTDDYLAEGACDLESFDRCADNEG